MIDRDPVVDAQLSDEFLVRLEASMDHADQERRRHVALQKAQPLMFGLLLIGPIVAWRLMLASSGTVHVAVDALAWLTFGLDVFVRLDGSLLSYLQLQSLPSVVGLLLLILVSVTLLTAKRDE